MLHEIHMVGRPAMPRHAGLADRPNSFSGTPDIACNLYGVPSAMLARSTGQICFQGPTPGDPPLGSHGARAPLAFE